MKKTFIALVAFLSLFSLVACSSNSQQNPDSKPLDNDTPDSSWGIFDNVSNIQIDCGQFTITLNNQEAISKFIDEIKVIEKANEIELEYGPFEGKVNSVEELEKYELFNLDYVSFEDEELLGLKCLKLIIEYGDDRNSSKIYEFIDGYPDIFENGDGMKIVYKDITKYYENQDNIIARKVVDMIKDELAYVQIYEKDEYTDTYFLNPYNIKTDEYAINGSYYDAAFYEDYWVDYTSLKDFTIYKEASRNNPTLDKEDIVDELPLPDGEKTQNVYLVDEKGHVYQYAYDRKGPLTCVKDEVSDRRYYCEYND